MDKAPRLMRVRPAHAGGPVAVRHPAHGELVVPNIAETYPENDPLVRAYPWLFVAADDAAAFVPPEPPESVRIETASTGRGRRRRSA